MANSKSGATNKYNQIDSSTNIYKNPKSPEILKQAKLDLLEDLGDKFEDTLVNRCQFADHIAKKRNGDIMPSGTMTLRTNPDLTVNIDQKLDEYKDKYDGQTFREKYQYLFDKKPEGYQQELKKFDTMLAERCILDAGGSIEFKKGDSFEFNKTPETESLIAFKNLNDLDEYKGKIERISKVGEDGKDGDYYVIKWKDERISRIRKRYKELLKAEGGDTGKKETEGGDSTEETEGGDSTEETEGGDSTKETEGDDSTKETGDAEKNKELEDLRKKNEELQKQIDDLKNKPTDPRLDTSWMKEWMEGLESKKNEELEELRRQNAEQDKRIKELEEKLNGRNPDAEDESKDKTKDETENSEEDKTDSTDEENNDADEIDTDINENIDDVENINENSNFISRSSVETQIVRIRGSRGYPTGTITIRGEVIHIEEFEFYEEFKQEYIEAKGNAEIISRLDKEFSEMIILFSPIGADYENRYCIKLSEAELEDGLYVSDERLAHYGLMIKVSEYFEKVVEREIIRERTIVRKLETVITELQTSIVELTESISIEKSSSTIILEEIRKKRKLLLALIKRQKVLLASLRGLDNNDEELKKLREEEARLQKEYEDLQKKRKHQNEVNRRIEEIEGKHNVLKDAKNAVNGMEKGEIIDIEMEDGKKISLIMVGKKSSGENIYTIRFNSSKFFEGQDNVKGSEILDLLTNNKDNVNNIEILKIGGKKINISFSISEEEKSELSKLKEEQKGFDLDIDKKISDKKKELDDIKKIIEQKESNNKKRVVVEEFDDGDKGAWFARYCEENGIKRKDGKKIPRIGGMDPDAIYVDKNGRELRLEPKEGANDDGYDNPVTHYELVYYEGSENGERSELEIQLIAIIEEQEALLIELEELEHLLIIAKTEKEKIEIKKRIRIINKKLTIISQKITEFESFIQIYKSRITIKKYKIFQIIPLGPNIIPNQPYEMTSVISDMGTDVFKEKAALKVEEEIKRQYDGLGRWQIGSRLALFLGRGSKRKRMMRNEMSSMANTAFQTGAGYATLNEQSQNAADRHGHELLTNMAAVNRITTVNNPQVDQLCRDYLNNVVNGAVFQQRFNAIVAADPAITGILRGQNITHIGTNILLQLKEKKAFNVLISTLDTQLSSYIATGNPVYMNNMQNYVEQYIKSYQKLPAFKTTFEQFLQGNINARNQLRRYLSHQKAIMNMQITNLRMNIDILNRGRSAYQIDNQDREKGWKYKVGHFMDKHPWGTAIGTAALSVGLGLATAPMSAVAGAAVTTGIFGSYVGFTNYIKKWTHHTKEQNTHEKNVVTDYRNEQTKIQNWQNTALNGHGRKKYKAKRQLALYDQTTQDNIRLSNQITEYITNLSAKSGPLTPNEDNFMKLNLIEGWARLKYYRAMGHNFLASEKVDETEKDMRRLEKAITLGLDKIGQTTNNIENTMSATNNLGTNITYNVIQNDLKASYDKSLIQFKRERRWLALRYGIGTAALSIGTALGLQYLTGSGVFSKDIPGTPGTPGTPSSTTSYAGGTDNFTLGGDNLSNGSVYNTTKSAISTSGAPNGSELTFNYGVGTDGTKVISSFNPASKFSTLSSDFANTSLYPNLSSGQVSSLQTELSKVMSDPAFVSAFKDSDLAKMRAMESLEHFARALNDSARPDLILHFNHTGSIPGLSYNTGAERFMQGAIDITTPAVPGTPGTPGIPAKTWGRWIMGVPLFFNTFKKRKPTKDTTDQNFGR